MATVSGQSFADLLKARIFDPLGMKHTVAYDASHPTRHKLAHGYWKEKDQFERWDYPMLTTGEAFTSGTTNDGTSVGYGFWITNILHYLNERYREGEQLLALGGADLRHVAHGAAASPITTI